MKVISFPDDEITDIKNYLIDHDIFHTIRISSEYGKYKKGEFVKTPWKERFVIIDLIQINGFEDFKKRYVHYEELKHKNPESIKLIAEYKKIEIIKLKKVDEQKVY